MRHLAACLLLLVLAGCAAGVPPLPLEVRLADLQFRGGGLFEQRVDIVLAVRNPNEVGVPVDGMRALIEVNGQPLARGVTGARFVVPRFGEALVPLVGSIGMIDIANQIMGLAAGYQSFDYRLAGDIFTGGIAMPFEQGGHFDFGTPR